MSEAFSQKTRQQVERLSRGSLQEIEREVALKRIAWCQEHIQHRPDTVITPRQAFETFFFEYMGLSRNELIVVRETANAIAWHSQNPCPTLDACAALKLNTRRVCRLAYEKSTQAFISQLDPQLRFLRSYQEIRPYASYCLEGIMRIDFSRMMELAVQEAEMGKEEGSTPGGAVIMLGKDVLAFAHDATTNADQDPGQHAEALAIYQAVQTAGDSNLSGAILFTTHEPCAACAALAVRANLTSIVFGVALEEALSPEPAVIREGAQAVIERSKVMIEMIGGVLADRCRSLYG